MKKAKSKKSSSTNPKIGSKTLKRGSAKEIALVSEPLHRERFDQLLDDAVLGVTKKK
jgi:hypothetical protein